ncbi:hypothetical protein BC829DRAFT_159045 [Chytridium lagenaria]|nr:hypothetical protein BC829DRAFT_159045 [Chytridium lagenaria]
MFEQRQGRGFIMRRDKGFDRPPLWSTGSVIPMHDEAVKQCQRVIRRSVTCNQGLASLGEGGSQREEKGDEKSDTAMGMLRQKLRKRGYTFRVLGRSKPVFEQNTALAVTGSDDEDVFVDAETGVRSPSPVVDSAHRSHGCRQSQRPSTDGGTRRVGMRRDVSFAGGCLRKGLKLGEMKGMMIGIGILRRGTIGGGCAVKKKKASSFHPLQCDKNGFIRLWQPRNRHVAPCVYSWNHGIPSRL